MLVLFFEKIPTNPNHLWPDQTTNQRPDSLTTDSSYLTIDHHPAIRFAVVFGYICHTDATAT